jgi:predicted transcriptional regulator
MKVAELKFALKLLGYEGYRAKLGDINSIKDSSERKKICQDLANRELVDYSYEVKRFEITPSGKALLQPDPSQLPVSAQQLLVLKACAQKATTPGEVKKLPAAERQTVIQDLIAKGFVQSLSEVRSVEITPSGQALLQQDTSQLPVSTQQLLVLKACAQTAITVGKVKLPATQRQTVIQDLVAKGLVESPYEVKRFEITSSGKALLQQDTSQLPVSAQQLLVLKACSKKAIAPGEVKLPAAERQTVIQDLIAKGYLRSLENLTKEVWLTERGCVFLREDCNPTGTETISLNLLQNYLRFLRKGMTVSSPVPEPQLLSAAPDSHPASVLSSVSSDSVNSDSVNSDTEHLPDAEILQMIRELDQALGNRNFLPIFHLRHRLQSVISRGELDAALYRLQDSDAIELSSLQETDAYTTEQISAGIAQGMGGALFYISVSG